MSVKNSTRLAMIAAATVVIGASTVHAVDVPTADLVNRQQLRVCADPADLPFSNDKGEGFENKIAELIAAELKIPVAYTWYPKAQGFIRQTLAAKKCDLVIGWGQGDELVLNTNAIYRSIESIIYKKGAGFDGLESLSDPRLKGKRIGIVQRTPGGDVAAKYGLMGNVHGYSLMVDRRYENPTEQMMKDLISGEIDVGVNWGPKAAYWAKQVSKDLVVVPMVKDAGVTKVAFRITMGVRPNDDAWKRQLNQIIAKRQGDIDKILLDYGIPIMVEDDTKFDMLVAPRANGVVPAPDEKAEGGARASKDQAAAP